MQETPTVKTLLNLAVIDENRNELFDFIEFEKPVPVYSLFTADKAHDDTKKDLDWSNKDHKDKYIKLSELKKKKFDKEKALIEKYLLPIYFPKNDNCYQIFQTVRTRELIIEKGLTFKEARKESFIEWKLLTRQNKLPWREISKSNTILWKSVQNYELLTPFEFFSKFKAIKKKSSNQILESSVIEEEWLSLSEDKKHKFLLNTIKENNYRKALTLINQLSELKTIPFEKNYLEIYIEDLYYSSLDINPIRKSQLEIVKQFESLSGAQRMKYIRQTHKERLIRIYMIYNYLTIQKSRKSRLGYNGYTIFFRENKDEGFKMAAEKWKKLSSEEKAKYTQKAAERKQTDFEIIKKPCSAWNIFYKLEGKQLLTNYDKKLIIHPVRWLRDKYNNFSEDQKNYYLKLEIEEKEKYEKKKKHFEQFGFFYNDNELNTKGLKKRSTKSNPDDK